MPSTVIRTASLLLCCVPWHPAEAQDVPHFDVDATCRAAPALTPQDRSPYDGCRGASSLPKDSFAPCGAAPVRMRDEYAFRRRRLEGPRAMSTC
jgi:hypothetical protein